MGQKERALINDRLSSLADNERLFRINAGMGWSGEVTRVSDDKIVIKNPRPFHGAPEGWPDLAGWTTVTITPDMVGSQLAVFTAIEVKATGRIKPGGLQDKFREIITRMGGLFTVLRA